MSEVNEEKMEEGKWKLRSNAQDVLRRDMLRQSVQQKYVVESMAVMSMWISSVQFWKMPRPVAHAIRYDVHGLGFYHIPHPPLPRAKKDTKLALILGGRWATLKGSFDVAAWEDFPLKVGMRTYHEDMTFITKFPSKMEQQRASLPFHMPKAWLS